MNWYLFGAIIVIILLLIIFVTSFVLYKRTPVPKGCEELKIDDEKCLSCTNETCHYKNKKEN